MPHCATPTPTRLLLLSLALSGTLLAGCSDDSSNNPGGPAASTTYVGLLASTDGQTGPLDLTFASPVAAPPGPLEPGAGPLTSAGVAVNVTGTLRLGGGPLVDITGVLDDDDVLAMSGGGYTLFGDLERGLIVGGFNGPAAVSGSLVAASSSDGSPALAFCGTFEGQDFDDPPTTNSGTFNLVVAGGVTAGVAVDDEGNTIPILGTSTSSSISINQNDPDSGGTLTATGTYNSTSITGTFSVSVSGVPLSTGSFSGGICGEQT